MVIKLNTLRTDGHLSAEAAALYVDALKLRRRERDPGDIRMHVEQCVQCKTSRA